MKWYNQLSRSWLEPDFHQPSLLLLSSSSQKCRQLSLAASGPLNRRWDNTARQSPQRKSVSRGKQFGWLDLFTRDDSLLLLNPSLFLRLTGILSLIEVIHPEMVNIAEYHVPQMLTLRRCYGQCHNTILTWFHQFWANLPAFSSVSFWNPQNLLGANN